MAHEYSVQVHGWIKEKISRAKDGIKTARNNNDADNENYYNGQLEQLLEIRQYLTDRIDLNTQQYYR